MPKGATIYGTVECDGKPVEGVVVTDGKEVVKTDKKGVYAIKSTKRNGQVYITIPSGYETPCSEGEPVPQFWAELKEEPSVAERHDFVLKRVDNRRHVILAVGDPQLSNRLDDVRQFEENVMPRIREEVERYRSQGIAVYTLSMGDSSFDTYWYDCLFNIDSYRQLLKRCNYPTTYFNTMGNHDNDLATPYDENTDFNAAEPYRRAFGPTYYSFNLGDVHYVMLDNIIYINNPDKGKERYRIGITQEQLDWLARDLAFVEDKATPVVVGMHSPVFNYKNHLGGEVVCRLGDENGAAFTKLLQPFERVTILSGHTHRNYVCYCREDSLHTEWHNISEHTVNALSGARWYPNAIGGPSLDVRGAPSSFKVFDWTGRDVKWHTVSIDYGREKQFMAFDGNEMRRFFAESGEYKAFRKHFPRRTDYGSSEVLADNVVMLSVWDYANDWKVEVYENGKPLKVERHRMEHPLQLLFYDVPRSTWRGDYQSKSRRKRSWNNNMFLVQCSSADSTLEIVVTDTFGNKFTETMERPRSFSRGAFLQKR